MKYVVLYVGHLYDSFWTIKIWLTWQGGIREGKNLPEKWPQFSFGALQGPLNGSRTPEINSNQSESVGGGPLRVHFRCPWHIWGPLGGSKAKLRPFLGQIFSFPDPTLPTQSDFYGPKWVVQVSHTKYYIFYVQLASFEAIIGPWSQFLVVLGQ